MFVKGFPEVTGGLVVQCGMVVSGYDTIAFEGTGYREDGKDKDRSIDRN